MAEHSPRVGILVDDLIEWQAEGLQPTGIQRAATEILATARRRTDVMARPGILATGIGRLRYVEVDQAQLDWSNVRRQAPRDPPPSSRAKAIAKRVLPWRLRYALRIAQRDLLTVARGLRPLPAASPVDIMLLPGSFWVGQFPSKIRRIAGRGVPVRAVVYDLIPVSHPEWFEQPFVAEFSGSMNRVLPVCERIVTLSQATAAEIARHYPAAGSRVRVAVPDMTAHAPRLTPAAPDTVGSPILLMLGTGEPRKNHLLVVEAWQRARRWPELASARLVIAGRVGC